LRRTHDAIAITRIADRAMALAAAKRRASGFVERDFSAIELPRTRR
jgi:hypothetical protein